MDAGGTPIIPAGRPDRTPGLLIAAGLVAALAMVVAEGRLGPRFAGAVDPTSWFGILASSPPSETRRGVFAAVSALSVVGLGACWWGLLRLAAAGRISPRLARTGWCVWTLPFLLGPPLMSRDVYAYAAQGELARRGLDPATVSVQALGPGRLLSAVDPRWRDTHAPYGGGATLLEHAASIIGGGNAVATVVVLRAIAVVAAAALVVLALRLVDADRRTVMLVMVGLNPLVLLYLVSGAHLDAVAAALLVGAVVAQRRGAHLTALLCASLAGTVKATAFVGVAWLVVDSWRTRGRRAAARDVGVTAGVLALVTLATAHGPTWLNALSTPARLRTNAAPAALAADLVHVPLHLVGIPYSSVLAACRTAALVLAGVITLVLLARAREPRDLRVVGGSSLAIGLLSPVLYPWYLASALPLLAARGDRWRAFTAALSLALCLITLPTLAPTWQLLGPAGVAGLVTTAVLLVLGLGWRYLRRQPAPVEPSPPAARTASLR